MRLQPRVVEQSSSRRYPTKREIKFRIFDGSSMEYNVMAGTFGVFYVNPSNRGLDEKDTASISNYNTKYPEGIDIMQFTGLKDINGKDIYEGDVIKCKVKYKRLIGAVEFYRTSFAVSGVKQYKDKQVYLDDALMSSLLVLGNIYESPELLNN